MTDNFQLYRALPRLSGNMQIDLVVDLIPGKANIREVHMRPIHNSLYVPHGTSNYYYVLTKTI